MAHTERMARQPCHAERTAVLLCRKDLGLKERECYPKSYLGECDDAEYALKKCLAFAVCDVRDAAAVYDKTRPRAERIAANKSLVACLARSRAFAACSPAER